MTKAIDPYVELERRIGLAKGVRGLAREIGVSAARLSEARKRKGADPKHPIGEYLLEKLGLAAKTTFTRARSAK